MGIYADKAKKRREELNNALGKEMVFNERKVATENENEPPTITTTRKKGTVASPRVTTTRKKGKVTTPTITTTRKNGNVIKPPKTWDNLENASRIGNIEVSDDIKNRGDNIVKGTASSFVASPLILLEAANQSRKDWFEKVKNVGMEKALTDYAYNLDNPDYNFGSQPIDKNSMGYKAYQKSQEYYDKALEGLSPTQQTIGKIGTSTLELLATLPTAALDPSIPFILQGMKSAASKTYDLTNEGKSATEALGRGLVKSSIDTAAKKIGYNDFFNLAKNGTEQELMAVLNAIDANSRNAIILGLKDIGYTYFSPTTLGSITWDAVRAAIAGAARTLAENADDRIYDENKDVNWGEAAQNAISDALYSVISNGLGRLTNYAGNKFNSDYSQHSHGEKSSQGYQSANGYNLLTDTLNRNGGNNSVYYPLSPYRNDNKNPMQDAGLIGALSNIINENGDNNGDISHPIIPDTDNSRNAAQDKNNVSDGGFTADDENIAVNEVEQAETEDTRSAVKYNAKAQSEYRANPEPIQIQSAINSMGESGKRAMAQFYTGEGSFTDYFNGFSRFYNAGLTKTPLERIETVFANNIPEYIKYAAYMAGQNDANTTDKIVENSPEQVYSEVKAPVVDKPNTDMGNSNIYAINIQTSNADIKTDLTSKQNRVTKHKTVKTKKSDWRAHDIEWFTDAQKKPIAYSTVAARDLIMALSEEHPIATVNELKDYINYDVEAKRVVQQYIEAGYGSEPAIDVFLKREDKESVNNVHNGILDGKGNADNGGLQRELVPQTEKKQDIGTANRELGKNVIAEDGTGVQTTERETTAERPVVSGAVDNGIRESDNSNGNSGVGVSGNDNVDDEVKSSKARDFSITKAVAEDLDTKSPSMEDNIKAIETLHDIENSNKAPTKAQQAVLAKFKGWGGLSNSFWGANKARLQEIMSDSEIAAAQSTVNDAYFTPTYIIDEIYKALNYLGFEGGNILEPSMGVGNFFGRLPKSLKSNSSLFGVEIDTISGRIAKYLYPSASIEIAPFQDVAYKDNSFDLIVGNVPFGEVKYKYKNSRYLIHDYFFVKAMDKLNDGGIMVFLTSRGTLDKLDSKTRAELNRQGKLIAAYRLPSSVFTRSAGASPVTDLIIMQKTADTSGERFVNTGSIEVDGVDFSINEYFVNHPENIIGELSAERNWRNGKYSLDVKSTGNVGEQLAKAMKNLPKNLLSGVQSVGAVNVSDSTNPLQTFIAKDDGTVEYIDAQTGDIKQIKKKQAEIAKAYINVKDIYQDLVDTTLNSNDGAAIENKRKELNAEYDNFVKKYGSFEKNKKLLSADNDFFKLSGLEIYDTKTKKVIKSEIFTRDTLGKKKPKKAASALDALSISISETGGVNLDRIKELTNLSEKDIVKQLSDRIVYTPDGTYELNEVYLSGNVREKYNAVKGKKGFEKNEQMLKAVIPEDIPAKNITPQFGAPWIEPKYVAQFLEETFGLYSTPTVNYDPTTGTWTLSTNMWGDTTLLTHKYGTTYLNGLVIAEKALNMRNIVVKDREGKVLVKETRAAQQKADDIKTAFEEWCFKDANRRQELVTTFNEKFNSNRNMDFAELSKYLTFDGLSDTFKLRDYQKRAVARAIFNGNTLLAHGVGTGKTAEMITIAMELKRMGIAKKNMMVVPPHKVADFRNDILKMYPSAKVAMLEKGANATQRKRFYAQVAANDFDIVIIPHTSFGMLDVSEDTKRAFITSQIAELEDVLTQAQLQKGSIDGRFIRQLENQKKRLEEKLKLITESAKDSGNTFEELGVDSLFVDEAHNFKNLPFYSKLSRVAGVSVNQSNNKTRASRAENMFMITDYLNKNNGRITFGTATPITNSMSEIYNMLRFLRPDILEESGIQSFDAWAAMFGSIVNQAEVDPSGRHMRMKERFSKFKNVAQMVEQFRRMADILKTNEVIEELPVAERIDVVNEPNAIQEEFLDIIDGMIDEIRTSGQNAQHNMLEVTTAGQMAAVDLRFVKSYFEGKYSDEELNIPNNRIAQVAKKVVQEYNDSNAIKGTQFVFCDVGVRDDPSKKYNLYVYGDLINRLVAGGIPREEIAIAQDFEDKADLSAKVNTGEIRVLIGSTAVMGEGMNAQNKAVALHHMTVPARPSDIEQREGRIIRYGNENKNVRIYRYIQEKSYDSYQWQMQERKASFINQALSGGTVEELEEMSDFQLTAREAKAIASGNPLLLEKIEVEDKLSKLKSLRNKFNTDKLEMRDRLATLPNRISRLEQSVRDKKADIQTVIANSSEDFEITFGKIKYTDRTKAAAAFEKAISKIPKNGTNVLIGSCKGLDVYYSSSLDKGTKLTIKGNDSYIVDGGNSASGNITRILNAIGKIQNSLDIDEKLLKSFKAEIKTLETEVNAEFPQLKELEELQAKLNDIDTQLGINISQVDMSDVVVADDEAVSDVDYRMGNANNEGGYPSDWTAQRVGDENKKPMRLSDIVNKIRNDFGINITTGHVRGGVRGQYNANNNGIRSKIANDLPTIAHELGHFLDSKYSIIHDGLDKELITELVDSLDDETKDNYPEERWKTEGFAEFIRRYLQNREVAAIDYPKFTAHFLNSLDGKEAALISELADEINAYYSLDADTATSSIRLNEETGRDARTVKEKIKYKASALYQAWVDANHGIKMFDEAVGSNAYTLASNAAYSDAVAGEILIGDLTDINAQYVSYGLKTALNGINLNDKEEYRLFGEYLVCKHGPERLSEGLRVFADDRKNSTAFMSRRADELEKKYPAFKDAAERLYGFIYNFYSTWAVGTGLISEETLDNWKKRWEFYVPFNRDTGSRNLVGAKRGFANQNSTIKKAHGSGLDIIHPVDGLINNIVKIVNAGTRNNVMCTITAYADRFGADAKFLEKVPAPLKVNRTNLSSVKLGIGKKIEESSMSESDKSIADEILKGVDDILIQYGRGKAFGDVITVLKDGNPEYWKINDPILLSSITSMSPKSMEGILDAYAVVSRLMTSNITGNNIVWSIFSNSPRDLMALFTYSKTKNPFKLLSSIGSTYINRVNNSLGKNIDPLYREFLAMGGGQTSAYTADRDLAKRARKKLSGKKFSANPLDWIAYVSDTIESGPRFATYKLMRESGMEPQEAFYVAMDITVNFRRGGRLAREVNKVVPFFNASVQGLDKFKRWITAEDIHKPGRKKTVCIRTFSFIAASAALAALFYALNNSDEENEKNYEQLSNYTKNSYWCIPLGDGKYFAIPKPRELAVLSSFFETCMEYGKGENEHAFDDFYEYAADNMLPSIASDIAQIGQKGAVETGMSVIGSLGIIGVFGYLGANRDFMGKPIVSSGLQNLEPKDQYTERTSKIAYSVGQALNVSPQKVDYFFQQVLGGWWKYQKALFPVGKENVDYTLGVRNTYVKDNQFSTDLVNWLYDKADASDKAKNSDPNNIDKAITAKLDSNMTSFYSRYYSLAKDKSETVLGRGVRQTVLDMINEYRKTSDSGVYPKAQELIIELCRSQKNTEYLPSVMDTTVKDGKKKEYQLSDVQYVEYQTDYLRLYWEMVEQNIKPGMKTADKLNTIKAAKRTAREEATSKVIARVGGTATDYEQKYKGISEKNMTKYFAGVSAAGSDGKTTQDEVLDVILGLNLSDKQTYQLFNSSYDRKSAKDAEEYGISAELYFRATSEMKDMHGDDRREQVEKYLWSVCDSYREYLFLLGTEYKSVKKDPDYIMYFG